MEPTENIISQIFTIHAGCSSFVQKAPKNCKLTFSSFYTPESQRNIHGEFMVHKTYSIVLEPTVISRQSYQFLNIKQTWHINYVLDD